MKRSILLLLVHCVLLGTLSAQFSLYDAFKYQAVARDAGGNPLPNQMIGLKFEVAAGPGIVYSETQSVTTNEHGLFSADVGTGTPDGFPPLKEYRWHHPSNSMFLLVYADFSGGTSYQFLGQEAIRAVPIANSARQATTLLDSAVVVDPGTGVYFDSTFYVGIGTSIPDTTLHVVGRIKYQDGNEASGRVLTSDADGKASWSEAIVWRYLSSPVVGEFPYSGASPYNNLSVAGIPSNARYLLADVFITADSDDHQIVAIGRSVPNITWAALGSQPSAVFNGMPVDCVLLQLEGNTAGQQTLGMWHSSQVIPLKTGALFDMRATGAGSNGWVYMQIRAWSE